MFVEKYHFYGSLLNLITIFMVEKHTLFIYKKKIFFDHHKIHFHTILKHRKKLRKSSKIF